MYHPGLWSAKDPALHCTGIEGDYHFFGSVTHLVGLLAECVRSKDL